MKYALVMLLISASAFLAEAQPKPQRITADELIAKHIASIGKREAIAAASSRIFVGSGVLSAGVGYAGRIGGPAQFASSGRSFVMAIMLNSNEYPYEKLAFDGKDISTGKVLGSSTELGNFVRTHPVIATKGLFGGVLSTGWALLEMEKGEKLDSVSTTTNNGVQLIKAKYISPANRELSITLYFDAQTFRHVMTEYKYDTPPPQGGPIVTEDQKPTYYVLTETFSNFAKVGELVLPLTHQIDVSITAPTNVTSLRWSATYKQAYLDQDIEKTAFKVS